MRPPIITSIALTLSVCACWDLKPGVRSDEDGRRDTDLITDAPWYDTDPVSQDPCHAVVCNTPPPDRCDSANGENAVIRYDRNGYCEQSDSGKPTCHYLTTADRCLSGSCDDSGDGPVCPEAPLQSRYCLDQLPRTCDGPNALIVPYPHGVLNDDGECDYPIRTFECDCDEEHDICRRDPCAEQTCNQPPARYCHDNLLVQWEPIGRCTNTGECWYMKRIVECDTRCVAGACTDKHLCAERHCVTPPANFCRDDETLYVYDPHGACDANGACVYRGEEMPCTEGCENGRCKEDKCKGVSCIYPPAPSCVTNNDIRVLAELPLEGDVCDEGLCDYTTEQAPCPDDDDRGDGCRHGVCTEDECTGMLIYCASDNFDIRPPAPYCDNDVPITYGISDDPLSVKCDGVGYCEFTPSEGDCSGSCELGQCVEE